MTNKKYTKPFLEVYGNITEITLDPRCPGNADKIGGSVDAENTRCASF